MVWRRHVETLVRILCVAALFAGLDQPVLAKAIKNAKAAQVSPRPSAPIKFEELDESEQAEDKQPIDDNAKDEGSKKAPDGDGDKAPANELDEEVAAESNLPTVDELVEAKLSALRKKQEEQEVALAIADQKLAAEIENKERTFDNNAYFSLSIINSAPKNDYRLVSTEILVDGKRIARGGKRNFGLPRNNEVFFGAVEPGCHDVVVKARYIRLKNDLIGRIKGVNRVEHISKSQAFVAKNGYRVELEIEGFESLNTFFNWFRGPALRFNRSVRPNFLPGAPIVSMDDVLKQGRVRIDYLTEDTSQNQLREKSLSIDGLPILVQEKNDSLQDQGIVFDGPLAEGKHRLHAVLLFSEKKWVGGGPLYNFRLSFDRDFYVISGQTTIINLTGMPNDGFRRSPENTRYARASSKIISQDSQEFFSDVMCKEQVAKQQGEQQKKIKQDAALKPKSEATTPEPPALPAEPITAPGELKDALPPEAPKNINETQKNQSESRLLKGAEEGVADEQIKEAAPKTNDLGADEAGQPSKQIAAGG